MRYYLFILFLFFNVNSENLLQIDQLDPNDFTSMTIYPESARFYKKKGGHYNLSCPKDLHKEDFRDIISDFAFKNELTINNKNQGANLNFLLWLSKWKYFLIGLSFTIIFTCVTFSPICDKKCITLNLLLGRIDLFSNFKKISQFLNKKASLQKKIYEEDFSPELLIELSKMNEIPKELEEAAKLEARQGGLMTIFVGAQLYSIYYLTNILITCYQTIINQDLVDARFENIIKKFSLYQIGGCEDAKAVLRDTILVLKNSEKCQKLKINAPKGILFYGPPGTGKTLLAKALAYEMNCPFIVLSPSKFVGKEGPKVIKEYFDISKLTKRAILFIDEIENIAMSRQNSKCDKETKDELMTLLTEMDGFFSRDTELIVIGATNYLDAIDPAILRPGRFDKIIFVDLPNLKSREEILKIHGKDMAFDETVDLFKIAEITNGFSGAQLAQLFKEAKIQMIKLKKEYVSQNDLIKIRDTTIYGQEINIIQSNEEIERKSVHESAHVLILHDFCKFIENYKVSIIPRVKYGMIETMETELWNYKTYNDYINVIKCCLASRAIEEINGLKDIYSDTSYDLQKANQLAKEMISKFGINSSISIPDLNDERVSIYVEQLLKDLYEETKSYLIKNKDKVDKLSKVLLKERFLNQNQLIEILSKENPKIKSDSKHLG